MSSTKGEHCDNSPKWRNSCANELVQANYLLSKLTNKHSLCHRRKRGSGRDRVAKQRNEGGYETAKFKKQKGRYAQTSTQCRPFFFFGLFLLLKNNPACMRSKLPKILTFQPELGLHVKIKLECED